jgi:hypothetical protein
MPPHMQGLGAMPSHGDFERELLYTLTMGCLSPGLRVPSR